MSGPPDGKYLIVLAGHFAPPPFPVGANPHGPISPVIVGGEDNVWTVRKLGNGKYTLILEQGGPRWLSKGVGENVVVEIMPLPGEWAIRRHPHLEYSIEVPSDRWPTKAWTLDHPSPGSKVKLHTFELPRPGQLWKFIPINKE